MLGTMQLEQVIPQAKELLTLEREPGEGKDLWLWEHSERVLRLVQLVAGIPELEGQPIDLTALGLAALFHDAGWAVQVRQGRVGVGQVLGRPTNDIQRELGAGMLQEYFGSQLSGKSVRTATQAIREQAERATELIEAQILSEANNLDEVGTMHVLHQFRQYQVEGRPLEQLVMSWQRQQEYKYWEVRLNDGFRFESTKHLAKGRLERLESFMQAFGEELRAADVARVSGSAALGDASSQVEQAG